MSWTMLCPTSDVEPGEMKAVDSNGVGFLVLRGSDGDALVVPATCPHMTADLCEGFFDGEVLTCAKHLWQWSCKDGSILGIAEEPLHVYPSRESAGVLEIDFDGEFRYSHQGE